MARYRHINVQVPTDLYDEFKERVPWGLRMHLFRALLELILEAIRKDGEIIMGALMSGEFRITLARKDVQNMNKDTSNGPTR